MKVGTSRRAAMTVRVLDDLVLVVRDLRLEVVADAGEQVAGQVEHVARAQELVVGAVEGDLDLVREDLGPALDLDHVVDDAANGVPHRRQRPPDVEQVVTEVRDPRARLRRKSGLDALFDLVDLLVQVVDQVEVALGDVVEEAVGDHARRVGRLHRPLHRLDVVRRAPVRRLPHRQQRVACEDDVDLLVEDLVALVQDDGGEEDAEDVVAVSLHRGTGLVLVLRLLEE
jgi:hypothetical protein